MDLSQVMPDLGKLFGLFVILVFVVYPLVLIASNKLVNGFWSRYWRTLGTVVLTGIAALVVNGVIVVAMGKSSAQAHKWVLDIVAIIVTALVGGALMRAFIKRKDGEPLPYVRTLLSCLVLGVVVVLISLLTDPWTQSVSKRMQAAARQAGATAGAAAAKASSSPATSESALLAPVTQAPANAASAAKAVTAPANAASATHATAVKPVSAASTH